MKSARKYMSRHVDFPPRGFDVAVSRTDAVRVFNDLVAQLRNGDDTGGGPHLWM